MSKHARVGMTVAGLSIAFSTLSFAIYFMFTPVLVVSLLFGVVGVALALAAKARRTALVAAVFALVPLEQLLVEQSFENEYFVFVPAAVAVVVAGLAFINYSQGRRVHMHPAT